MANPLAAYLDTEDDRAYLLAQRIGASVGTIYNIRDDKVAFITTKTAQRIEKGTGGKVKADALLSYFAHRK
ncbi:MAG: hypothetical protein AABZ67_00415 [Pseudomonadota bacterium]